MHKILLKLETWTMERENMEAEAKMKKKKIYNAAFYGSRDVRKKKSDCIPFEWDAII